jgi:hypothetical protein
MTAWTSGDLARIGEAEEIEIAALRPDGHLRKPVIIWVVRQGNDLYVRSVRGAAGAWLRGTQVRPEGRIWADGQAWDVSFVEADHAIDDELDEAYRVKYRAYADTHVPPIVRPEARATTLKLVPRAASL